MARRIQPIFDKILADTRLSTRDRDFVTSLQAYYKRKKMLTQGRRRALLTIEERLNKPVQAIDPAMDILTGKLSHRADLDNNTWAMGFIGDIRARLHGGREMTPGQKAVFDKLVEQYSDEAAAQAQNWAKNFGADNRAKLAKIVEYYKALNGRIGEQYYGKMIDDFDADPEGYTPTESYWNKLTSKGQIVTLFAILASGTKYAPGSFVSFRTSWMSGYNQRRAVHSGPHLKSGGHNCALVIEAPDCLPINAVKGGKLYSILLFGEAVPTLIEERHIKKAKM